MTIQGLRTTANFAANQRPENWRDGILRLYPNGQAPLTALTSQMKSASTDDPVFHWWEKSMQTRRVALTTNLNNTDTSTALAATGGGFLAVKAGDLLMSESTGEIMYVSADPTSDTGVTVTRGVAGTTTTALTVGTANPYVVVIGSAYEEGSLPPTGVSFDPNELNNYTQIFRNTFEITGTADETNLRTGDEYKEQKRECLEVHSVDIERALWFGKKSASTRNGRPWRTMNGVIQQIPTANIKTFSSAVVMSDFEEVLKSIFDLGSNEKMGFCGNRALLTLQQLIRRTSGIAYNIDSGTKEYGMNIARFVCPFGTLVLKTHPLFNQMAGVLGSYNGMDSTIVILDMEKVRYRFMKNRDTKFETNLQAVGQDGKKDGYKTEASIELNLAKTHFMVKGMTSADSEP